MRSDCGTAGHAPLSPPQAGSSRVTGSSARLEDDEHRCSKPSYTHKEHSNICYVPWHMYITMNTL